jgi:hypothetical protein
MATAAYLSGRRRYQRPQAMLWSNNAGTLSNGLYVPIGYEVGANAPADAATSELDQFLIISDHNRQPIEFKPIRIEKRERTINGRMRSYHIADKMTIATSWDNLPSRAYPNIADFGITTGISPYKGQSPSQEFTVDGGAGGAELLDWYENHKGPFWIFLSYDKYKNFAEDENQFNHLNQYSQIMEVYISDFSYSVQKRGGTNMDLWNVSVTLEEV